MLPLMKKGAVMVDVAIDQGGCFETSHATTHTDPIYFVDGVLHYCVSNMPAAVPHTSTFALNNATFPYLLELANQRNQRSFQSSARRREHLRRPHRISSGRGVSGQAMEVFDALNNFAIELPSWGFANTGTRFGKFIQEAAATTTEEKFADAGQVHAFTGCCPTVAMHVKWDFPCDKNLAAKYGVAIGSINPNLFEDQIYKHGSLGNPDPKIRAEALRHLIDSVEIAKRTGSRDLSLWFADGSNFPGTANIRQRRQWFEEGLKAMHARLDPDQRILLEYKPFEPAFYHTDIADWGMSLLLARAAGPQARVLVDTGHHYQAQNIEQIVVLAACREHARRVPFQ